MELDSYLSLGPHGFHRVAYMEWGSPLAEQVVVCAPGLTRNARDFDALARAMRSHVRLVCMDVVGRGRSDWLAHKSDYSFRQYQTDAAALIARITVPAVRLGWFGRAKSHARARSIDWVGTSMGGLIGMLLAAQPGTPLRRLVLNDVGPFIPWSAMARLKGYAGKARRFPDLTAAEAYIREVCAGFGPLDEAQWRQLAENSVRRHDDGDYELAYDPGIAESLWTGAGLNVSLGPDFFRGINLWKTWDAIRCPTLVLRGANSDVLTAETALQMTRRGPPTRMVELPGVGHAPALVSADQIATVGDFLTQ